MTRKSAAIFCAVFTLGGFFAAPIPAYAEGFDSKDALLKASTEAVNEKNMKKFIALYPFGTSEGAFVDGLKKRAKVLMDAGVKEATVSVVWPENSSPTQEHIGYVNFISKKDPNVSSAYPFGRMKGKYYLILMTERALKAETQKKDAEARQAVVAPAVQRKPEPAKARGRSTGLTHRLYLKNGQQMECTIAQKDAKGMWIEMAPGARAYVKTSEVAEIVELDEPKQVIEEAAPTPKAAAPAMAKTPVRTSQDKLGFSRGFIETLDRSGWDLNAVQSSMCSQRGENMMRSSFLELADAGGIKEWLETKGTPPTPDFNAYSARFDLLFNAKKTDGPFPGRRAALIVLTIEEKEGSPCVGGLSYSPRTETIAPEWSGGAPEGQELLDAAMEAVNAHDEATFMALFFLEGADPEMAAMSKQMIRGLLQEGVEQTTLKPAGPSDNDPMENAGYRYRPTLPIVGTVNFKLKNNADGGSFGVPFGKKNGKYYFITSMKEKI